MILMGSRNDAPVMQGAVDVLKELGIDPEKYNVDGGAIAFVGPPGSGTAAVAQQAGA